LRAGPAADAVVFDDRDLAALQANDAVHAAEEADRVFAVTARRRERVVIDLEAAQLEARVLVTPAARFDARLAVHALLHVDDEHLVARREALLDEDLRAHRELRARLRATALRHRQERSLARDALRLLRAAREEV